MRFAAPHPMVRQTPCLPALVLLLHLATTSALAQQPLPRWSLGDPAGRFGGERHSDAALSGIQHVTIGKDHAVYVADATAPLRLFEPDGRLTRAFGQSGQRSGEFVLISAIGWLGDTLWVIDDALRRATYFEPNGRLLTSSRVSVAGAQGVSPPAVPFALLTNGSAVTLLRPYPGTGTPGSRPRAPIVRSTRRGSPVDTFATIAIDETVLQGRDRIARPLPQPFSDAALVVAAPDGEGIIVVERPAPTAPGVARYRVVRYTADGRRTFATDHSYIAEPLPRALVDSVRSELVLRQARGFGGPSVADSVVRAALNAPAFVPPVTEVIAGRDGSIWLLRAATSPSPGTPPTYDVLDPSGLRVATLPLPRPGRIVAAELRSVWVAESGDQNLMYIIRYPVVARP